ncbi:TonB-dependent receptor [Sphingomonas sp.]|uniref:TonB-dependent receptor n=1 Tax=Sphingomonas sp. TaxID=28214 RepID=UPI003D6C927C
MIKRSALSGLLCAGTAMMALAATPAFAQSVAQPPSDEAGTPRDAAASGDGDIIVTARRREENLQKSPVAVTAFSGAQLESRGITNVQELANVTPGLSMASALGSTLGGTAAIRSQSQPETSEMSLDPSVGFYVDDVYIARQNGIFPGLFDIQSVQTLKGPQGTLFGRNTTGGAVLVTTRQPELGVVGGFGKVMIGNYDARLYQGGVNLPLGDNIAIRAGGSINRRDGFARGILTGHQFENEHNEAYRLQALFRISDSTRLTLAYNGAHADQGGVAYFLTEVDTNPATGIANSISIGQAAAAGGSVSGFTSLADVLARQTDPRRINSTAGAFEKLRTNQVAATLDFKIGETSGKIIAAHRHLISLSAYDQDASPFSLLGLDHVDMREKQDSAELRFNGTSLGGSLDWIAGAYYMRETGNDLVVFEQLGLSQATLDSDIRNETYSAFVQADYKFTSKLSATAGIRVGRDNRRMENRHTTLTPPNIVGCQLDPAINLDLATGGCRSFAKAGFTQYAYQLGLTYQANDRLLLYATTKRGFRSGVLNERAVEAATQAPLKPEVIYDFEAGAKLSWSATPDLRGYLNSAVYYSIFNNRQISFSDITPAFVATTVIESAKRAHTWGFEVEAGVNYSDWLSLTASVAHTDPKYDVFTRRTTGIDVSGQAVSNTPKWQYALGARVSQPLGSIGRGFLQADYAYTGRQFFGFSPRPSVSDPGHGLLNLSAGIDKIGDHNIAVHGFVKNATNKTYLANAVNTGFFGEASQAFFGMALGALGAPRTYGVEVSFDF